MVLRKYCLLVFMLCAWGGARSQGHLFTEVRLNKSNVYVGEPVEVTVSVLTSTWFTKGVDLQNIKVNGAFTVYFRSLSMSRKINGKTYAGVEMYYNIFPYDDKDIVFPSLEINVETPDDGGYKGVAHVIKTKSKNIKIKSVPAGFNNSEWLVTSNMRAQDSWSGDLSKVKVGDVLTRKISRNASGTVSELIPPIVWDTLRGVSLYPQRSEVENHKTKISISASRSDIISYLFEKEGEITIPQKELTWWNPVQNKLYKRTLKAQKILVAPNPDLGMITSIRDSLEAMKDQKPANNEQGEAFTILGISPKAFAFIVLVSIFLVYVVVKILNSIRSWIKERNEQYHNSEAFYFQQFKKATQKMEPTGIIQSLYRWIDKLNLDEPSIQYFALRFGASDLKKDMQTLENHFGQIEPGISLNLKAWEKARKNYLKETEIEFTANNNEWINP